MKLFGRNVKRLSLKEKSSLIGAAFIIMIGIFFYEGCYDTLSNLKGQIENFYEDGNFGDVFAEVSAIPDGELARLTDIEGIEEADGKLAADLRIQGPGMQGIVSVHLMSYEEDGLNRLSLSAGNMAEGEIYLGRRMSEAYGYSPGQELSILEKGKARKFRYKGECLAPDYIYIIMPGGSEVPDGSVYDLACVSREEMEDILGVKGVCNQLSFKLSRGYEFDDVKYELTERLESYGLKSLYDREDQPSFAMVKDEMKELSSTGSIFPIIFMGISAFMLYVVLKKFISGQKKLIGTMKAFGMKNSELIAPYIIEGAAIGGAGAFAAAFLSGVFGRFMFQMYVDFFNLPDPIYHDGIMTRIAGFLMAISVGILAVLLGVREIISIQPAQAMRTSSPKMGKWTEKINLNKIKSRMIRIAARSSVRNPGRGALLVLAVMFPMSLCSILFSFGGVMDDVFFARYEDSQLYDLQLVLSDYDTPKRAEQGALGLAGVTEAEGIGKYSAKLKNGSRTEYATIYGLNKNSRLWRIMDNHREFYEPDENGLMLNSYTAAKLHVSEGDTITFEIAGLTVAETEIKVSKIVNESNATGCYMEINSLAKYLNSRLPANLILVKTEPGMKEQVRAAASSSGQISQIVDTVQLLDASKSMMGSMEMMMKVFGIVAAIAGGVLIYNISMINIRERLDEFGTLMILGCRDSDVSLMLKAENMIYFALGVIAAIPGAEGIKQLLLKIILDPQYDVDFRVQFPAYALSLLLCALTIFFVQRKEMKFITAIDLTEVLKERD